MATREDLKVWIVEALEAHGGSGTIHDVAKHIWINRERELRLNERLFYSWQYDIRWAAKVLRDQDVILPPNQKGIWELNQP